MDEAGAAALLHKALTNEASPAFGSDEAIAWEAVSAYSGPERILDIRLRTGPYGDGFGANPDGLSLAKLIENPHGIDLGPLEPRLPVGLMNKAPRSNWLRKSSSLTFPGWPRMLKRYLRASF